MPASNKRLAKWDIPKLYPLYAAALSLFLYSILFSFLQILGYGNNTILCGDLYQQYIAFIRLFLDTLQGKGDLGYSFSLYLGAPTASTFAGYCMSPFNLLYLIPGISASAMTVFVILLKHALAAAAFQYFSQKGLKTSSSISILFSVAYALCAFSVSMQSCIMWLDALYILPVLMLVLLNYVRGGSFLPLVPVYAYLFLTNFYMGHMVGIFSFFCFVAMLTATTKHFDRASVLLCLKKCSQYLFAVLLAIGSCALELLPAASQFFALHGTDPFELRVADLSVPDILGNLFAGQMQGPDSPIPLLYCGLPALLLFSVYFSSARISRKEKIAVSTILILYVITAHFIPAYALNASKSYAHSPAFCGSFVLLVVALRALPECRDYPFRKYGFFSAVLLLFYAILIPIQRLTLGAGSAASATYLLINAGFLFAYLLLITLSSGKPAAKALPLIFTLLFSAELLCNGYTDMSRNSSYRSEDGMKKQLQTEQAAIAGIQSADPGLYRIRTIGEDMINAPSYHHYAGVNSYAPAETAKLRAFLNSLGIAATDSGICDQGYTELTDMLFGIKYAVSLQDEDVILTPVSHALPLAFLSTPAILSWQNTGNPFVNQENLVNALSGKNARFYTPVSFENIDTYSQNMDTYIIDGRIYYQHITDSVLNGIIRYTLKSATTDRIYGYIPLGTIPVLDTTTATIQAVPSPFSMPYYLSLQTIAEAPAAEDGSRSLEIDLAVGPHFDTTVSDVILYSFDDSAFNETYSALSAGGLQITGWKDGAVSGIVTSDEAHPILFTTIPYDKGWTALVDEQVSPVYGILDDTFLCLYLTPGTHTITLQYEDPMAAPGSMISVISTIAFLLLVLTAHRRSHTATTKVNKKENADAD